MPIGKKSIIISIAALIALAGFFYFRYQVYFSKGSLPVPKIFEIKKGEGNLEIAEKLEEEGIISGNYYFLIYLKLEKLSSRIMPGAYSLSGKMTIAEIAQVITNPEEKFLRLTFPEGFTARKMAEEISQNGLPGEEFLKLVENPGDLKKRYSYLGDDSVKTLEGYLFPDTYFFKSDISAKNIAGRMLDNFDQKITPAMREKIIQDKKSLKDVVIMASIVEREVQSLKDMKIVAGIFWKRLESGMRLQSDAPLSYFLDDKKDQHSGKDLEIDTPYNTYRYQGLPPGPIGNPGIRAIEASLYPQISEYNFFFTAETNGEKQVIYSKNFEEHVANRNKYGI